jgi:hypothetical protein
VRKKSTRGVRCVHESRVLISERENIPCFSLDYRISKLSIIPSILSIYAVLPVMIIHK